MTNDLQTYTPSPAPPVYSGCFNALTTFKDQMDAATMLASAAVIPKEFQNKPADCLIALDMALRLDIAPFQVFQSLYVVHGKPAWSGQFYIACINKCGRFTPIQYQEEYDKQGHILRCRVYTKDIRSDTVLYGPWVSIEMAKAEGWYSQNPKWRNMPEVMLRYRSAAFFAKTICPDVTMGLHMDDEVIDAESSPVNGKTSDAKAALVNIAEISESQEDEEYVLPENAEETDGPSEEAQSYIDRIHAVDNGKDLPSIGAEIAGSGLSPTDKAHIRKVYMQRQAELMTEIKKSANQNYDDLLNAINRCEENKKLNTLNNACKTAYDSKFISESDYMALLKAVDERSMELGNKA